MKAIPYIIGAIFGGIIVKLFGSGKKEERDFNEFYVYIRGGAFGKCNLIFEDYEEAKNMYDKIAKSGKVKYQDVLDYDEKERIRYEKNVKDGLTKEEHGINFPQDIDDEIDQVAWGKGSEQFESKEF